MPTAQLYDEKELLRRLSRGDEYAFKEIFDAHRESLFYYVTHFIKSKEVAEELVMDVFMKIWLGRELAIKIENFDSFLFRIAHNKSINFLRSADNDSRLRELLLEEIHAVSDLQADSALLHREFQEKVREAISLLSPQRRKVYQMSREKDLTHDQIAAELNISPSTVNNQIVEAQRFIRKYLLKNFDVALVILFFGKL